jgi:hypothetical protein
MGVTEIGRPLTSSAKTVPAADVAVDEVAEAAASRDVKDAAVGPATSSGRVVHTTTTSANHILSVLPPTIQLAFRPHLRKIYRPNQAEEISQRAALMIVCTSVGVAAVVGAVVRIAPNLGLTIIATKPVNPTTILPSSKSLRTRIWPMPLTSRRSISLMRNRTLVQNPAGPTTSWVRNRLVHWPNWTSTMTRPWMPTRITPAEILSATSLLGQKPSA